jgi:hypothetical protein
LVPWPRANSVRRCSATMSMILNATAWCSSTRTIMP